MVNAKYIYVVLSRSQTLLSQTISTLLNLKDCVIFEGNLKAYGRARKRRAQRSAPVRFTEALFNSPTLFRLPKKNKAQKA